MGAGLQIDRPPSLRGWNSTWRLLGITMVLTIVLCALVGWWIAAFAPATAMLLGAVIAPTDPVLASEVQVGAPGENSENNETKDKDKTSLGEEDEVRFALTSEAGLNDGLAFPFTNMAIAMAIAGPAPHNWIRNWLLIDVLYQLVVAIAIGLGLGYVLGRALLAMPAKTDLAIAMIGLGALASTLLVYGLTEYFGGYGFIATFIAAIMIRNHDRSHRYHHSMHVLIEKCERILTAVILLALGSAIAGGLLATLNWHLIVCALLVVFIIRPVSGICGMIGYTHASWRERLAISFFGIRGIGSLYYLAYALNEQTFSQARDLWALVALIVVISIFVHGISATPIIKKIDQWRENKNKT
ncbi:Na+/H+ antiporter [Fulvivirga imtechensis AK7]|uniref:Na+/H+ antiporter n=2 Tax=Fulvivirga TaxID=396811 RepID=L8JZ73_9BACT|nr:Na+/H+ antiporter [Fulvivirga imtechensis AK7]